MPAKVLHHHEDACYRCGMKGHWSRTCRTPKYLVDLYQASKEKVNNIEINFTNLDGENDITNLDVSDFFVDLSEKLNFLTGDGFISTD